MAVNLDKQNRKKVNLSKEQSIANGKVKLDKTFSSSQDDGSVISGSFDETGGLNGDSHQIQTDGSKYRNKFAPWLMIPIAAIIFLVLIITSLHMRPDSGDDYEVADTYVEPDANSATNDEITDAIDGDNGTTDYEANRKDHETADIDETANMEAYDSMDDSMDDSTDDSTDNSAETAGVYADDEALHDYEIITADVTWEEAFHDCVQRGGYLCRINSEEENEKIKELLNEKNVRGVVYIGGIREENSNEYHWVDRDRNPFDEVINSDKNMKYWFDGEPSFFDMIDDKEIPECYMAIIYPGAVGDWVWNDVSNDVLSLAPNYYTGRLSYICEYE